MVFPPVVLGLKGMWTQDHFARLLGTTFIASKASDMTTTTIDE